MHGNLLATPVRGAGFCGYSIIIRGIFPPGQGKTPLLRQNKRTPLREAPGLLAIGKNVKLRRNRKKNRKCTFAIAN
jgi:hypothetical protein